ncbi:MAG: ABC transporter permease [Chitinophagaceae bacterium]
MSSSYSQVKAMLAITRASLKAIFRSPQAVFFSLFFPVVLIAIFGALGGNGRVSVDVAFDKNTDTANALYHAIATSQVLNVEKATDAELADRLKKGRITALISIIKQDTAGNKPPYNLHLKATEASMKDMQVLQSVLKEMVGQINEKASHNQFHFAVITSELVPGRPYKMIDFYLPGMLGFSLIGAAVFGVAFVFYTFRETLVLKRLFSTPIKRTYIVVGESLARIIFQLTTAVVLILFGKFFYNFTLAHGWITFVEMMFLCLLGLIVFMGFGFAISGFAKNQNVIPVYANLFMFPQYFLSGTFFPKGALPESMQSIIRFLPLTAFNDAMRKISFEGLHLWNVGIEIAILLGWAVIAYALAVKAFKWE